MLFSIGDVDFSFDDMLGGTNSKAIDTVKQPKLNGSSSKTSNKKSKPRKTSFNVTELTNEVEVLGEI